MLPEGGSSCFLDVQKYHHIVGIHVELEVIVEDLLVAEPRIGQQILLHRFAQIVMFVAGDKFLVAYHFASREGAYLGEIT